MFAIYVHVPWCKRRCPYCDFYLEVGNPHSSYIDSLLLEWQARYLDQPPAQSLYFGGGTPSMLSPFEVERLVSALMAKGALAPDAEITLEANPEDLSPDYLQALSQGPINRLSLGIQSFDDKILRFLGRKHDELMARSALELTAKYFRNISVDQIIGVPKEDPKKILSDLSYVEQLGIPHVSCYLLTIEENTNFARSINKGLISAPDDDYQADIYLMVQAKFKELSFIQYDISSYAKQGFFSRHNQVYWGKGEYVGLGPGAHSLRLLSDGSIERLQNRADIKTWLKDPQNLANYIIDKLDHKKALLESLAFGLRNMAQGIDLENLSLRHQEPIPESFFVAAKKFKELGWLEEQEGRFKIGQAGALYADAIMREVLLG